MAETPCPNQAEHYESGKPDGYVARQEWFVKTNKTHRQRRCTGCKLYVIWEPRQA